MNTVGVGYDVHRLVRGRPLILGGVRFDHSEGLDGHSDADVLCHAIADALLGAMGQPDIGFLFPNTDPSIKDISSLEILREVRGRIEAMDASIINIDATLIAERPKIGPRLDEMKQCLGQVLGLAVNRIGIKATTNETLGSIGRGEGMAAFAVALVNRRDLDT